jgi:hypothetical protein
VTAEDAERAMEMSASLRRRMLRVQPFQSRALAVLSRASLRTPYTLEVPTVRQLRLRREKRRPTGGRKISRRGRLQRAAHRVVSRRGS